MGAWSVVTAILLGVILVRTSDLLARALGSVGPAAPGPTSNTTISLVITNRKMEPADLQRLAVQVHTSMARAIQPFSTYGDGDTLFAVSTQEVGDAGMRNGSIDFVAAETIWDAILASVPTDPPTQPGPEVAVPPERLSGLAGRYRMGPHAVLDVIQWNDSLRVQLEGPPFFDLGGAPAVLHATSDAEFYLDSRYGTRLTFLLGADGKATGLTINPGRWGEQGKRISE